MGVNAVAAGRHGRCKPVVVALRGRPEDEMLTIAHPTALTDADALPFAHSVALTRDTGGKLFAIHASNDPSAQERMPEAQPLLMRWGNDQTIAYERLLHSCCEDPVDTLLDALRRVNPDLLMVATSNRKGLLSMFVDSRAKALARNCSAPTLFFPPGSGSLLDDEGHYALERIVVPFRDSLAAKEGIRKATWLAEAVGAAQVELTMVHLGPESERPKLDLPDHPSWSFSVRNVDKPMEEAVAELTHDHCMVVMASRGHDTVGDILFGTDAERVLLRAHSPVLVAHVQG